MTTLAEICSDLDDEQRALDGIVAPLSDAEWDAPTPAEGWTVRDQISHLAFFDEVGALAASDPDDFNAQLGGIAADPAGYMNRAIEQGRALDPNGVLAWWRGARAAAMNVLQDCDPATPIPWFGPPMKPISFVTGRLMETWAHGQDVVDAVGADREPTARLRHVAHMGVRARGFSFQANGQAPPDEDVRVELTTPGGDVWSWGGSETDIVRGEALDFCLVVTQRRHPADTNLDVKGPVASSWVALAQAFAGPPGAGRKPGQFPTRSS